MPGSRPTRTWSCSDDPVMKTLGPLAAACAIALCAPAQETSITLDDEMLRSAEQWARENLDEDVLRVLQDADQQKIRELLRTLQERFHGEYVVDLGLLKDSARSAVPLLERYQETLPYALWLKTRLDELDVADRFRLLIPPPKTPPGSPLRPAPNPSAAKLRELWLKEITTSTWPANAKPYVHRLQPIFAAEKVPPQLVWVAEVESSFDPRARSPEGAAGLFQLMPATANRYGLRTWPLDQRVQPEASARAAAQYLRYLYAHFKDWRLALAAYNAGEGTVQNLLAHRKAANFEAIAPSLPAETQLFVPKIEATLWRREGVKLSELKSPKAS